ncbi:hypothetical protein BCR37DRAFT_256489 [Protomyces lactucae-debilis]|uniref:Uncharacterized protein n=1 Tax=Protomyces lactucae-debilis TaxID=2754530 RepID=A0A1Y2FLZ0_PROLT|nr:uncharacterized protein BCR37DRAFT_256489 [Protomyces lactucae-debilis]ORY84991.1 hypothetical protein BCR37DRAFT_256489 [Protomyces lactucae-debilis]
MSSWQIGASQFRHLVVVVALNAVEGLGKQAGVVPSTAGTILPSNHASCSLPLPETEQPVGTELATLYLAALVMTVHSLDSEQIDKLMRLLQLPGAGSLLKQSAVANNLQTVA